MSCASSAEWIQFSLLRKYPAERRRKSDSQCGKERWHRGESAAILLELRQQRAVSLTTGAAMVGVVGRRGEVYADYVSQRQDIEVEFCWCVAATHSFS